MEEYIVSARKYRPITFDTVVGQQALTQTLKNAVKSGKLAHAYLFCGPRGVGKTTCARIFAKAINCQSPTSDGEACNQCESCLSFNEQRSLNIFELDAASNNSVEHIKTLMEQTRIPPQLGKYKVFIIDEVHMLSTAAFNAFLKTLEEPPAHVIFILATTEKHKILPTILSRCQIYDFERMTVQDTIAHLKKVAEKEGYTYEEEALAVIAEKADGGMRDALSVFDQCASFCQGNITYQKVIEDLNVLDSDNYFNIIDLSLQNKVSDIMVLLNGIINNGFDGGQLIMGLAKHVRNVLLAKDESTLPLLEVSAQQRERYKEQAQKADTRFLYQALRYTNQCDINYRQSSNKRLLVELTLIEIAQITQPDDGVSAGRRPNRLKTLFKLLTQQQQPVQQRAPQVAPAVAVAKNSTPVKTVEQGTMPVNVVKLKPAQPQQPATAPTASSYTSSNRPRLKSGGFSWNAMRNAASQQQNTAVEAAVPEPAATSENVAAPTNSTISSAPAPVVADATFTQDDLELVWLSMCNRMPQKFSAIALRMKNITPHILQFPHIEILADNQIISDQLAQIKGSIVNTLRRDLKNKSIEMSIRLAAPHEKVKILSDAEVFEQMGEKNPAVEKLRELFGLELT
ncbi:MAG: DNA polymerase III subunit gamma/tau [Prevotella sp.]|nr:DNA polymerase III subunit gamma/tau [Prevotella sp.]